MEREQMRRIEDTIMESPYYPERDPAGQQDEMHYQLQELIEQNALTPEEADECFQDYMRVFHYEGRS